MTKDKVLEHVYAERGGGFPHNTDDTWTFDEIASFVLRMIDLRDQNIMVKLMEQELWK